MTFVTYEDRSSEFDGIRVLLRSMARHQPDWSAIVFLPNAPSDFAAWCKQQSLRSVRVITDIPKLGWNSKPLCLLRALREGHEEIVWLDSDIAAAGPIEALFTSSPRGTVIAAEEAPWFNERGTRLRTEGWGMKVGRSLPVTINSCAMRFDTTHIPLLEAWAALLQSEEYVAVQLNRLNMRPVHMKSDQDALNALLGSESFASTPVRLLKNGTEIAQCFEEDGYQVCARVRHSFRALPALVHAQGSKPWRKYDSILKRLWVELSPYPWLAGKLCGDIPEIAEWSRIRLPLAKACAAVSFNDPSLRGLLPAVVRTSFRAGRPLRRLLQRTNAPTNPALAETRAAQ